MKVGVLGNDGSWYVDQLCSKAVSRGHHAVALQFTDLQANIRNGDVSLQIGETQIAALDAVIVRTMPPGSLEQVVSRMDFLAAVADTGVQVINAPKAIECAVDKYLTTQKLAAAGIPVPDTVVCESADTAMDAFEQLGGDVVVKPLFGAEGRGILRADQTELALRVFRTLERLNATLYLQRFNQGPPGDLRILLLDGKLVASMERKPKDGDFRANAAQDGTSRPRTPTDIELELAIRAADVTGCVFSGIDLMHNEHGEPVIIEVNAVPGWRTLQKTCKIDVPDHLFAWLEQSTDGTRVHRPS